MSVINTNITSMIGQQNLQKSQNALTTSMERLSSGLRINSAKDDAAGQAIANRFTAQITGLNQASRNANDGISIAQTAEGSLNQINDNLQRIRELTVQAANGTNSATDRQSIQDEVNQRLAEIDRISEETDFNGIRVLSEDADSLRIQVGANDGQTIDINLRTINAEALGLADFDVRAAVAPELSEDAVTEITTGDDIAGFAATTTFADDVTIAGGNVTLPADPANFGAVSGSVDTVTFTQFVTNSVGELFAQVEITGSDSAGDPATATAFVAISASNISAGGTVDLTGGTFVDEAAAENTVGEGVTAASTSALTFSFEYTQNFDNEPAGTIDFVERDGELFIRQVDGDETNLFAVSASAITASGTVTFDFDGAEAAFTATTVNITEDASIQGTLREVLDSDGEGTNQFVDDRGDDGLFLVNVSDGGTATVAEAAVAGGDPVEVRFGGIDGETLFAQVEVDGEMQNFAVTGNATDGYEVDLESGAIAVDATENPLAALDAALQDIDNLRSELGAVQNRFEDAITNLDTNSTNLSAARSRIEDADYAMEVADMTRAQILQQAGTSVLAQANQIPQNVLSLLG
ncbi:flagellin [Halomonas sp. M1]|uniref:flagellin N-terminal helical domain-containing protein n=1 Tax=Halomonas sp. M1 TaxID=3035470 RepID=UPI0024856F62|nr:flagellin [Halomonas sp. M1]WFE70721.1 flagellin [Halomonas sp. M1]